MDWLCLLEGLFDERLGFAELVRIRDCQFHVADAPVTD
jgi:hypothetical protein